MIIPPHKFANQITDHKELLQKVLAKQTQARNYVAISWIRTTINIFSNLRHKVGDGVVAMMELHSKTSCNEDKTCQLDCKHVVQIFENMWYSRIWVMLFSTGCSTWKITKEKGCTLERVYLM